MIERLLTAAVEHQHVGLFVAHFEQLLSVSHGLRLHSLRIILTAAVR